MKLAFQAAVVLFVTLSTFSLLNARPYTGATKGCCPAVYDFKNYSLIGCTSFYQCFAFVLVSAGSCLPTDTKFAGIVDWGDGTSSTLHQARIDAFKFVHQYPIKAASYLVMARYCSDPDGKLEDQCCDTISQKIDLPKN